MWCYRGQLCRLELCRSFNPDGGGADPKTPCIGGTPLPGREGAIILKYFLVERPRAVAPQSFGSA
jgi:hypothetical protein